MGTRIPTQSFSHYQNFLGAHLNAAFAGNPASGMNALQMLNQVNLLDQMQGRGGGQPPFFPGMSGTGQVPTCGCLPPPNQSYSAAPAGRGLATNEPGWPAGTVTTAGGYRIVPEGKDAAWGIFAPGQQPGEKAHTRIWGDPHVDEKDGTRWDFTKNSDFVLPDGTRINAETTAETGQSVSAALNITNGADRVRIDGIAQNRPTTGQITNDGYEWRAQHLASNPARDSFHLGGDQTNVHWTRERNGQIDGVITGAHYDAAKNGYEQKVDPTLRAGVHDSLRPDPFTNPRAWGNMMRGEANDAFAKLGLGPDAAAGFAWATHQNHNQGAFQQDIRELFNSQFGQFSMLMDLMRSEATWQQQLFRGQVGMM